MITALLLLAASHRSQFIKDTLSELKTDAARVGNCQSCNDIWITRAEVDITVARDALKHYRHGHCSEEDVRTVMSQLSRDMEDLPPVIQDGRPRA